MIPSDIYAVLQWWFVLFLLGVGFLPLTIRLFSPFFDKGYLFSLFLQASLGTSLSSQTKFCPFRIGRSTFFLGTFSLGIRSFICIRYPRPRKIHGFWLCKFTSEI